MNTMSGHFKKNQVEGKLTYITVLREYKIKNHIKDSGYSDQIRAKFVEMNKETINKKLRMLSGSDQVYFGQIVKDNFKDFNIKLKKAELSTLINIKFGNTYGISLELQREDNKFAQLIKQKFTSVL